MKLRNAILTATILAGTPGCNRDGLSGVSPDADARPDISSGRDMTAFNECRGEISFTRGRLAQVIAECLGLPDLDCELSPECRASQEDRAETRTGQIIAL